MSYELRVKNQKIKTPNSDELRTDNIPVKDGRLGVDP